MTNPVHHRQVILKPLYILLHSQPLSPWWREKIEGLGCMLDETLLYLLQLHLEIAELALGLSDLADLSVASSQTRSTCCCLPK
jgi:hypothetical protein